MSNTVVQRIHLSGEEEVTEFCGQGDSRNEGSITAAVSGDCNAA